MSSGSWQKVCHMCGHLRGPLHTPYTACLYMYTCTCKGCLEFQTTRCAHKRRNSMPPTSLSHAISDWNDVELHGFCYWQRQSAHTNLQPIPTHHPGTQTALHTSCTKAIYKLHTKSCKHSWVNGIYCSAAVAATYTRHGGEPIY